MLIFYRSFFNKFLLMQLPNNLSKVNKLNTQKNLSVTSVIASAMGKCYIVHCFLKGAKTFYHGYSYGLQTEYEIFRSVRIS